MLQERQESPIQPGPNWIPEERTAVVLSIIDQMEVLARWSTAMRSMVDPGQLADFSDRIRYTLTMPKEFLEANRDHILKGNKPKS